MQKICRLIRRSSELVTEQERAELPVWCDEYVVARLACLPADKPLTPKEHCIDAHICDWINRYSTLGIFGEDGLEGVHPKDTKMRELTRGMREPLARLEAHMLHLEAAQMTAEIVREKRKRTMRAAAVAAAAAAEGAEEVEEGAAAEGGAAAEAGAI